MPTTLEEIAARLASIEQAIASLAKPATAKGKPLRLTAREACELIGLSRRALYTLAARGVLTRLQPKGRGRGKPVYYLPDEIEALAVSEDAARELAARRRLRNKSR